jgi:hypothetical protein
VNPWAWAIWGGLLYSVPFGIWLLGSLQPAPDPPELESAHRAFLWTQVLALILLLPALVRRPLRRSAGALILLQAVPWPLLPLFVLTDAVAIGRIVASQAAVALGAIALALLWHLVAQAAAPWQGLAQGTLRGLGLLSLIYATPLISAGRGS